MKTATGVPSSHHLHWLLLPIFLVCYPLSEWLPPSWAWENGIVENAQVAVLLAGALLSGLA